MAFLDIQWSDRLADAYDFSAVHSLTYEPPQLQVERAPCFIALIWSYRG
jgi:hypothetical protein